MTGSCSEGSLEPAVRSAAFCGVQTGFLVVFDVNYGFCASGSITQTHQSYHYYYLDLMTILLHLSSPPLWLLIESTHPPSLVAFLSTRY